MATKKEAPAKREAVELECSQVLTVSGVVSKFRAIAKDHKAIVKKMKDAVDPNACFIINGRTEK